MAGFLDQYGVADERRERLIKRLVIWTVAVALIVSTAYFTFRTRSQEQTIDRFLADLREKKFQDAYNLWCTPDDPCRYYPLQSFIEDWGPASKYPDSNALKVENVDYCNEGVVFRITYPNQDDIGLSVKRSNNVIGFAPWTRCPGRHLQLGEFFRSLFSGKTQTSS